jgi:predicted AAA+ superfamily ATPase
MCNRKYSLPGIIAQRLSDNYRKIGNLEVDFVCKRNEEKVCSVSYMLTSEETIEREFNPLMLIQDNYPKYVITMDEVKLSHEGYFILI